MPDFILTQGDVQPRLEWQLQNPDGSAPDLTGADVECRVQPSDGSRQASVTNAVIIDARGGYVGHDWLAAETAFPGSQLVQFRRKGSTLSQQWPFDRYIDVLIKRALTPPALSDVPVPAPPPSPIAGYVDSVNTTGVQLVAITAAQMTPGVEIYVLSTKTYWRIEVGQGYPIDANHVAALGLAGGQWVNQAGSGAPSLVRIDFAGCFGSLNPGEDVFPDEREIDFDHLDPSLINMLCTLFAQGRVTGGTGTFRVRVGGTAGTADGTVVAIGTTASTGYGPLELVAASFAKPSGLQRVKLTMSNDTAGQTSYLKGAAAEFRGA